MASNRPVCVHNTDLVLNTLTLAVPFGTMSAGEQGDHTPAVLEVVSIERFP